MPFEIIRNDITLMRADAIVNTANPLPIIGGSSDARIHEAAGPELLEARKKIGPIAVGEAAVTPAFRLGAQYVIHTVGPQWRGGGAGEEQLLENCYRSCLALAREHGCASIAFPLISSGTYGFPRDRALQCAIRAISGFLMANEMQVWLVVFHREAYQLSEKLFRGVRSYIDEHYVEEKLRAEIPAGYLEQDEDVLSYALFDKVALKFFEYRKNQKYGIDKNADHANGVHTV